MRNKENNKGVTLVALVVTIIVLLILAGISIGMLTGNNGMITKAQTAKAETEKRQEFEDIQLAVLTSQRNSRGIIDKEILLEELIKINPQIKNVIVRDENGELPKLPWNVTGATKIPYSITQDEVKVRPGEPNVTTGLFEKNSTINGGTASANNPTIPAGYRPIDVTTGQTPSSWGDGTLAPTEASVKNGLVITDAPEGSSDGNEFVWIPVETISEMAREIDGASLDANGNKQYRGVLYSFGTTLSANSEISWSASSTSYREPANLEGYDTESNVSGWNENLYQQEYNKMVKQVEKYKGFYVGRYETSLDSNNVAQSKNNKTSAIATTTSANAWYGLYTKQRAYAQETDKTKSVVSSMIWGSQYDAMMRWMQNNGVDVNSTTSSDLQNATKNPGSTTGGTSKDIINNIYDIWGNRFEWTQEANRTSNRVSRGGSYGNAMSPSNRSYLSGVSYPSSTDSIYGSRFTLYIK